MYGDEDEQQRIEGFIAHWRQTGGSELANTQSFINGLCALIGVNAPCGSRADDAHNDYVFERRVFQDNGDGSQSFGRIDCYKRDTFILEAKQGSDADRAAADRGEDDLDFFGQTASTRMKRGTARRGTPGWARAMVQAKGQAERYAKALPVEHGWPPFLLVADIGYCIEVYADFTGTGKAYAQFPDRARYRIMLEDLRDPQVRERLHAIWTEPKSLDPTAKAARVTRDIAELLATIARRIEKRGYNAEATSSFLMRVLFTMFAEDTGLIPHKSFTTLLKEQREHPEHLEHQLSALWAAMDKGDFSPALGVPLRQFNGYLFKDRSAIPVDAEELDVLIQAAEHVWTEVEPAIFGTLLERALDPKERAKLGAHYTPRAYVERLVGPTIMEPLRADWDGVRGAAATLIDEGEAAEARAHVEAFHARLAQTKVLDPACGTGNFLYVAMARMKELEGEVLDLLVELGDDQYLAEITGHTITPENFLGIEINPRAAAIAQLVLWIGYLQWHFRVSGADRAPPEPILRDVRTIENRDALIEWDDKVAEGDEAGNPVTRWDGGTMKEHPVTGKKVPDETAQVQVYRYVKPRATKWPKADFIVGNPPFIGKRVMRARLSDPYVDALRSATNVPDGVDFVMYWWSAAADLVRAGSTRRFGLVTTNSISQGFNARLVDEHLNHKVPIAITYCIPNAPWVDDHDGADVRVSVTVGAAGLNDGHLVDGMDGLNKPPRFEAVGRIGASLTIGADVRSVQPLKANSSLCAVGFQLNGKGFIIDSEKKREFETEATSPSIIFPLRNGSDINRRPRDLYVIDADLISEAELKSQYPQAYQHLLVHVKPERDSNREESRRVNWWLFGRTNENLRMAMKGIERIIVGSVTSKHRIFDVADASTRIDSSGFAIALPDPLFHGVVSSRIHCVWSIATGTRMGVGDDPRYNKSTCFEAFPFPADVSEPLKGTIRAEAEALDTLRKWVLESHEDLTLTKLYNVVEALRKSRALTQAERDIHDRGLVTLIRQHHDSIDALVAEAYGWPADLSDEDILTRLVALNKQRAAEEAKGLIRWLRPEYQAPKYKAPVTQSLDLGEAAAVLPDNVIAWPKDLPEQVSVVQQVLAASQGPLAPQDVARAFKGKRAATVRPVLEALAGIGMARRLENGKYAV